jgi:Lrp/AsnC family transcriptional regulator, leucine-responsive regulatory protein
MKVPSAKKQREPRPSAFKPREDIFDEVNLRLLRELLADSRLPTSELARRVGMSAPAVRERVQRLEAAGVIAAYRTELDPVSLGFPVTAFVRIRPVPGALPKIAQLARELPAVSECYRITGEDCFIAKVHAGSIEQLEDSLDRFLAYGNTTTSIVVSVPVPPRHLPLPGPSDPTATAR